MTKSMEERMARLEQWKEDFCSQFNELEAQVESIDNQLKNGISSKLDVLLYKFEEHVRIADERVRLEKERKGFWMYFVRAVMIGLSLSVITFLSGLIWSLLTGKLEAVLKVLDGVAG